MAQDRQTASGAARHWGLWIVLGVGAVAILLATFTLGGGEDVPEGRDYLNHCAAAGVKAKYQLGLVDPEYRIGEDPVIEDAGSPERIACPYRDARGRPLTLTISVICEDVMESRCIRLEDIG